MVSPEDGRRVYERLEPVLDWNHHYWLQRGGLEVQEGDLSLATNFLGQARSLAPEDDFVQTEWNYLLMKKAAQFPFHASAHEWFHEGYDGLLEKIDQRGSSDAHPYHILGSQTLAWVHAASLSAIEKRTILHGALEAVKAGARKHFRSTELEKLSKDLETAWLMTSVGE
jgi:hypothetical protein